MFFTIALDVVVAALILYRQRRIRPVRRVLHLRLPVVLGVIGLIQVLNSVDGRHVSAGGFWLVLAATVVGAGVLGVLRALTVRIWESNQWIVRQGTWVTMALWVVSLAVHLTSGVGAAHLDAANFEANSFLLYLGLTLGVQAYVVHRRAAPQWDALGPEAGRPLVVTFGAAPGGAGSFFAGFGGAGAAYEDPARHDPSIIDVEVVDEEDPPELR
jgi:hypothetical protein